MYVYVHMVRAPSYGPVFLLWANRAVCMYTYDKIPGYGPVSYYNVRCHAFSCSQIFIDMYMYILTYNPVCDTMDY
jgi:hypothetical protein